MSPIKHAEDIQTEYTDRKKIESGEGRKGEEGRQ